MFKWFDFRITYNFSICFQVLVIFKGAQEYIYPIISQAIPNLSWQGHIISLFSFYFVCNWWVALYQAYYICKVLWTPLYERICIPFSITKSFVMCSSWQEIRGNIACELKFPLCFGLCFHSLTVYHCMLMFEFWAFF